jgi:CelD/BcsL family acetyltransferase involved in cellulose biosynthesis
MLPRRNEAVELGRALPSGASVATAREHRGVAALAALTPEWQRLCDVAGSTPFQRPEWLLSFAEAFDSDTVALTVESGNRLVALVPLAQMAHDNGGVRAMLLGTGLTDHLDVIVDPAHAPAACDAVAAWLVRHASRWCEIDLQQLPPSSPLLDVPSPPGFTSRCEPHDPCPMLPISAGGGVPPRMRSRVTYYKRRAEARGAVTFTTADADTYAPLLDVLFELHHRRWADNGGGVLGDARVQALHRAAAARFAVTRRLLLHSLTIGTRVAAACYGFISGDHACYYIGGFDPAFADVSPGTLVVAHAIEDARQRGARVFDFLRGQERYKYSWGASDWPTVRRVLSRTRP